MIARATGSNISVVAVLDIHMDNNAEAAHKSEHTNLRLLVFPNKPDHIQSDAQMRPALFHGL